MKKNYLIGSAIGAVLCLSGCSDPLSPATGNDPDGNKPQKQPHNFLAYKVSQYLGQNQRDAVVELRARGLGELTASYSVDTSADGSIRLFGKGFQTGTYNPTSYMISEYHTRELIYSNEGKIFSLPVYQVVEPIPRQMSSESDAYRICMRNYLRANDYASPQNSRLVYKKIADATKLSTCATEPGSWFMIALEDDSNIIPRSLPGSVQFLVDAIHNPATGAISGWLVVDNGVLVKYNTEFAESNNVLVGGSVLNVSRSARILTRTPQKRFVLAIDNKIYIYDASQPNNEVFQGAPVFSAPTNSRIASATVSDGVNLFFAVDVVVDDNGYAVQSDLYSMNLTDGSVNSLYSAGAGVGSLVETTNNLVFGLGVSADARMGLSLKKLAKTGGVVTDVVQSTNAQRIYDLYAKDSFYYVNYYNHDGSFTLYRVPEAQNTAAAQVHHRIIGVAYGHNLNPAKFLLDPLYFVLAQHDATTGEKNIHAIDVSNGQMTVIGGLPSDITLANELDYIQTLGHSHILLGAHNSSGIKDLYYFDAAVSGSLKRLTENSVDSQSGIYYKLQGRTD